MAKVRRIVGIAVLVVGVILIALAFTVLNHFSETIPASSSQSSPTLAIVPQVVGSGTLTIGWSGATSDSTINVYPCSDSTCASFSSTTAVASGTGSSGSLSFSATGYSGYGVVSTSTAPVTVNVSVVGISIAALIGIILAVIGLVLAVLPSKARASAPAGDVAAEEEAGPVDDTYEAAAAAPGPVEGVAGSATNRPMVKCAHCGTMNEPWITNCRWCKRTLTST